MLIREAIFQHFRAPVKIVAVAKISCKPKGGDESFVTYPRRIRSIDEDLGNYRWGGNTAPK